MKETFKQAGYKYGYMISPGVHCVIDPCGLKEVFYTNKNHASWGLIYKNTHLEFLCRL